MKKVLCAWLLACLSAFTYPLLANDSTIVRWIFESERISDTEVLLSIKANVSGAKLYSLQKTDEDALYSTVTFDTAASKYLSGSLVEKGTIHQEKDMVLEADVSYFTDSVLWQQKIRIDDKDSALLKGAVSYMYKTGEEYLPGEESFRFIIEPG